MRYDGFVAHTACRALAAVLLTVDLPAGYEPALDLHAIDEAIAIGQSRLEAVRVRFHQPYRIQVNRSPVDSIDVVTPFRRVALAAEERARTGDRLFRQREALAALAEHGDRLTLFVELTFHPLNTYLGVPPYVVALAVVGSPARIEARDAERIPRFGARVNGMPIPSPYPVAPRLPSGSQPLLGGTVIANFENARLNPRGMYDVVIEEAGKELARVRVDLGALR